MPMIKIEYDDAKVSDKEVASLSEAIQEIVSSVTQIEDVFVYANSARIKVKIAPIEVFVQMSAHKITDVDKLTNQIKSHLSEWKSKNNFQYPINLTLIPMNWKIEIGI